MQHLGYMTESKCSTFQDDQDQTGLTESCSLRALRSEMKTHIIIAAVAPSITEASEERP